jgi:hypothetical protein
VFRLSKIKTAIAGFKTAQSGLAGFTNLKAKRYYQLQNFWVSHLFMIIVLLVMLIVHCVLWVIVICLLYKPSEIVSLGCGVGITISAIVAVECLLYVAVQFVLLILLYVFKVRDRWNLRLEITTVIPIWAVLLVVTGVLVAGSSSFYLEAERYWPGVIYGIAACYVDLVVSIIIPVILSFRNNRLFDVEKQNQESDLLSQVLIDPDFLVVFKEYCIQSLTVETLCFYEDYNRFKCNVKQGKQTGEDLMQEANQMIEKYLRDISPLMLNLPNKKPMVVAIEAKLQEYANAMDTTDISELFASVEVHVLFDLQVDVFSRFKLTQEYQNYLVAKEKSIKAKMDVGAV